MVSSPPRSWTCTSSPAGQMPSSVMAATVAALTELGICPPDTDVHVALRGGELTIRVLPGNELRMTGAAETVCEGTTNV